MKTIPKNWHLVEECENNFIYENSDHSFRVEITFAEQRICFYSIGFTQLKGIFNLIGFENGAYSTKASEKESALDKAIEMMKFIDKSIKNKYVRI